jgi:HEAT repeat protein
VVPAPVPRAAAPDERQADIGRRIEHLSNPDARVRADVAIELGRMKAERAVDALTVSLSNDASPAVRESAARALGLIGSPRALPALQRAAQADADRDVRNSARFATDVIQTSR